MSKVGVVILQYNQAEATLKCLESILKNNYEDFFVVLVDNCSNEKNFNKIKDKEYEKVKVIRNSENSGYGGGNNLGADFAIKNGADFILILNNDTTVPQNIISELVKKARQDMVLSVPINEGHETIYGGMYRWLSTEGRHLKSPTQISPPLTYLVGACLFIPKNIWQSVGPIDDNYFLYFEDMDYCARIKKAGFGLNIINSVNISHEVSLSTKKLGNPALFYLHYRNSLIFQSRFAPWYMKIILPFYIGFMLLKIAGRLILQKDKKITKAMAFGIKDYLFKKYGKPEYEF